MIRSRIIKYTIITLITIILIYTFCLNITYCDTINNQHILANILVDSTIKNPLFKHKLLPLCNLLGLDYYNTIVNIKLAMQFLKEKGFHNEIEITEDLLNQLWSNYLDYCENYLKHKHLEKIQRREDLSIIVAFFIELLFEKAPQIIDDPIPYNKNSSNIWKEIIVAYKIANIYNFGLKLCYEEYFFIEISGVIAGFRFSRKILSLKDIEKILKDIKNSK